MAVVTAPEFDMAVNAPAATVLVWLRIMLLLMFSVGTMPEFKIPVIVPVPVFDPAITLLLVMSMEAAAPEFRMPLKTEAPVPYAVQFCTVLPVMETTPVAKLLMPLKVQIPVVVVPVPTPMLFAVAVLPMVLPEMLKFPVPAVLMPWKVNPMAVAAPVVMPPMVLFCMETAELDVA